MTDLTSSPTGLELIRREQARQAQDAQTTWSDPAQREGAERIAARLRQPGASLLLLGMGASHHANAAALAAYRALGLLTVAVSLDEALSMPLPPDPQRVTLLVSQSGESGELHSYLEAAGPDRAGVFGLTLNPQGQLARQVPGLIAAGGAEQGFAATRSYLLTLVLHGLILRAWGSATLPLPDLSAPPVGLEAFRSVQAMVFAGSGGLAGLAAMAALGTIELGRFPALHYDLGQLRHGPLELLGPGLGVMLLRAAEESAHQRQTAELILQAAQQAGSPVLSLTAPASDAAWPGQLGSLLPLSVSVQQVVIDLAGQRVERVGEPVRSAKVTR
ncbi:phosphosugar isomerase [Deinococcus sonorensis]|uniref:Glutamine--fructose-6-phosphate aminotransferase [isomerizing] n=2 Tax=Deinococcus sonorensis TaxID=309891 RepID=A0AAU7UCS0_9DEIO